jgi:hypothetical protein
MPRLTGVPISTGNGTQDVNDPACRPATHLDGRSGGRSRPGFRVSPHRADEQESRRRFGRRAARNFATSARVLSTQDTTPIAVFRAFTPLSTRRGSRAASRAQRSVSPVATPHATSRHKESITLATTQSGRRVDRQTDRLTDAELHVFLRPSSPGGLRRRRHARHDGT